jgi:hypothetical protein
MSNTGKPEKMYNLEKPAIPTLPLLSLLCQHRSCTRLKILLWVQDYFYKVDLKPCRIPESRKKMYNLEKPAIPTLPLLSLLC